MLQWEKQSVNNKINSAYHTAMTYWDTWTEQSHCYAISYFPTYDHLIRVEPADLN